MKKLIYIFIGAVNISCLTTAYAAEPAAQGRYLCQETVACGPSVRIDGNKVVLDRGLIHQFAKKPTLEMLEKNLWEIIYFVSIFDKEAMSAAINLMATVDPKRIKAGDHHGIRPLARALTHQAHFWDILGSKPLHIRKKVIQYFDINKTDYTLGYDYEVWKLKILQP